MGETQKIRLTYFEGAYKKTGEFLGVVCNCMLSLGLFAFAAASLIVGNYPEMMRQGAHLRLPIGQITTRPVEKDNRRAGAMSSVMDVQIVTICIHGAKPPMK